MTLTDENLTELIEMLQSSEASIFPTGASMLIDLDGEDESR
jgi:hypothetical protein